MNMLLFGVGLLVATSAFYLLTKVSKLRRSIQDNVNKDVASYNPHKTTKQEKAGKVLETA